VSSRHEIHGLRISQRAVCSPARFPGRQGPNRAVAATRRPRVLLWRSYHSCSTPMKRDGHQSGAAAGRWTNAQVVFDLLLCGREQEGAKKNQASIKSAKKCRRRMKHLRRRTARAGLTRIRGRAPLRAPRSRRAPFSPVAACGPDGSLAPSGGGGLNSGVETRGFGARFGTLEAVPEELVCVTRRLRSCCRREDAVFDVPAHGAGQRERRSISRPFSTRSSSVSRCEMRATPCSIIGPSSRTSVT